jgi:hypothetical protein
VRFNATGLATGTYYGNLSIASNDTFHTPLLVPMRLTVLPSVSVPLASNDGIPATFVLAQNYPNPFNPVTIIRFGIPANVSSPLHTTLRVYDVLGREVATLVDERLAPGMYTRGFETTGLSTGIYFYRLTAGNFVQTKKMVFAK